MLFFIKLQSFDHVKKPVRISAGFFLCKQLIISSLFFPCKETC